MQFEFRAPRQERALVEANTFEAMEDALRGVLSLQARLGDPALRGYQMFSLGLDALVPRIAAKLQLPDSNLSEGGGDACIVATQFYAVGGHTKVADDISAIVGRDNITAILTDAFGKLRQRQLLARVTGREHGPQRSLVLLSAPTLIDKIIELYTIVAALRPSRIFLMSHHMDVVAPVALWPFRDHVEFVHHADHLPTLGATMPFAKHVDLTFRCHQACREAGLNPVYAGMTAPIPSGEVPRLPFSTPERVRIATCGSQNKYWGGGAHSWGEYAAAALLEPGSELLHFGPVDDRIRADVAAALAARAIDPARYVFAGPVPNLAKALADHEVDVYLGSYPESGGKASLEAMAVGLRPIIPLDLNTPPLLRIDYPIPTWRPVASPDEVAVAIGELRGRTRQDVEHDLALVRREAARFDDYVRCGDMPHR